MPRKTLLLPQGMTPAAVNEPQAAEYTGVCRSTFRTMVDKGIMPPPRRYGTRKIWIIAELDAALLAMPRDAA